MLGICHHPKRWHPLGAINVESCTTSLIAGLAPNFGVAVGKLDSKSTENAAVEIKKAAHVVSQRIR